MPERLQARRISWKVYMDQTGGGILDNVLTYFAAYAKPGELADRALHTSYPNDFLADVRHNRLPAVSWILTDLRQTEHPGYSSAAAGEVAAAQIVKAVMSNPKVWSRTALFITWDENGGFFDHVAPPVAPPGTKGEYLTVSPLPAAANGIAGPLGLGSGCRCWSSPRSPGAGSSARTRSTTPRCCASSRPGSGSRCPT